MKMGHIRSNSQWTNGDLLLLTRSSKLQRKRAAMVQEISDKFRKAEARTTETRQFIRDIKLYIQNIPLMGAHRTQVCQQR
jgi:hypothetical protein